MRKYGSDNAGFTLLELMVVLAILGVSAMLVVPNIGTLEGRQFDASLRESLATLNAARRDAVVTGQTTTAELVFDDASLSMTWRESEEQQEETVERVAVQFFPEGGSTGGELRLRQQERQARISVDPFTGRVRLLAEEES